MELGGTAVAAAAVGGSLFDYNRKNFLYDRKMRQETEYQIMDFRIKQAQLWREDVKDIIGLTSVKMDTYLIVNAVQLGFCVMAFCEGRLAVGTPVWLIGCHTLSLAGAFMYLLMSVWLSMHASVTAKSYEVRLLTQLVRLPVPSWAQLEGARTYSSGFEKADPKQMFRVPFVMGSQEKVLQGVTRTETPAANAELPSASTEPRALQPEGPAAPSGPEESADVAPDGSGTDETADVWGLERRGDHIYELDGTLRSDPKKLRHLRLVREAMQYWQSYDGFARVAMSVGTNQLVAALSYYVIGYVLISNHAVIAAWLVVMLFMVVAAALIRLDMSLTGFEYRLSVMLIVSGPCLTAVAAEEWSRRTAIGYEVANLLTPITYAVHALWLMFLLYISNVKEQRGGAMLPTGFRSVMYIDVFGWIKRARGQSGLRPPSEARPAAGTAPAAGTTAAELPSRVPGAGPAVQAVRYQNGVPLPLRPEELPGAAQSPFALEGLRKEDFEPTTFVPREKYSESESDADGASGKTPPRPGVVPWRLFCSATVLLVTLWWVSGIFMLLASCGIDTLKVAPLLREGEGHEHQRHGGGAAAALVQVTAQPHLSGGEQLPASWPSTGFQPRSLACTEDSNGTLVLLSHFGIFSAQLDAVGRPDSSRLDVRFVAAPLCEQIEGEALQDVAVSCDEDTPVGACRALVLHRQGERLSACRISTAGGSAPHREGMPQTMHVADEWLSDGNAVDGIPQEEVTSISLAQSCPGSDNGCAFVETSGRRIVELQMTPQTQGGSGGAPYWFPTRILQAATAETLDAGRGGALHLVAGQYLGSLQANKLLKLLDPQDGSLVGEWRLPEAQQWRSMCSMGAYLYFLAEGRLPQLWRFPLPDVIRAKTSAAPTAGDQPHSGHGRSSFLSRHQHAMLVPHQDALG